MVVVIMTFPLTLCPTVSTEVQDFLYRHEKVKLKLLMKTVNWKCQFSFF